ncbi:MAG: hypothetical protein MR867_09580 [Eubacterium sp.]|nr:hypothetical protein [Eubacterium sp.]MDD7210693.1 hypothetical protein [Lachnospiraceae bacterium]MDY5496822.1 hypothetical protein [Anaerobutyricum sp.]
MDRAENRWVSLREICEERRVVTEEQTGKQVGKTAYFASMKAMIEGAMQFADFFQKIHEKGQVYASSCSDKFFFDLMTGDFRFEGEKLLGEEGEITPDYETLEFTEFLAPELVCAALEKQHDKEEERYTLETDWYFMSVFLFEYFFHTGSPFEGKKMVNRCFLSPEEKELYRAKEGHFCMEPEEGNMPVKGIQDKLIKYWEEYPDYLKKMFRRAFLEGGTLRELRPTEVDWKQLFVRMAMDYKECSCGFHGFSFHLVSQSNGTCVCPKCGKIYYPLTNGMDRILLAQGEKLYECQTGRNPFDKDTVTGLVVENRQKKGLYGIKNISKGIWRGGYPDGKIREIPSGQGIPIWHGMQLRFETGEEWNLRLVTSAEKREDEENEQTDCGTEY